MADETTPDIPADADEPTPVNAAAAVATLATEAEVDEDTRPTVKVRDRTFHLRRKLPGMVMLRLSAAADPTTPVPAQMSAMFTFFRKIVASDEAEDFIAYLEDADPEIEFDELTEVMNEAMEVLGGRPT